MKRYFYIYTFFSLSAFLFANQFNDALGNELSWLKEETYVISASRVKEDIDKTASSITVIDEEMIEKIGANNLTELLETVAGVGITQSFVYLQEIEMRGIKDFTSKQVLFMVDGHSLDAFFLNGGATINFSPMSLDNIKRIEIIKGPASALYGGNAFAGLVNIITKDAEDIDGVEFKVKSGSYNYRESNLLFGKRYGDFSIVANANIKATNGESDHINKDILGKSGKTDPKSQFLKADLKINYKDFYFQSIFTKRDEGSYYGPVGALGDDTDVNLEYLALELGYRTDINEKLRLLARVYQDYAIADNFWEIYPEGYPAPIYTDGMKMVNANTNRKDGAEAMLTYRPLENYTVVFGTTFETHKQYDIESLQNYDPETFAPLSSMADYSDTPFKHTKEVSRDMWAGYINNIYDLSKDLRLTVGARYDYYSDFGSNFAPRGGVSWQINEDHIFKAMYGEGFRTPTFAEYYNVGVVIAGNNDLKPEYVSTYEMSLHSTFFRNLKTKLTVFKNDYTDLIVQEETIYKNVGEVETKGLEVEAKYTLNRGSYIMANYTYQSAKDELNDTDIPYISQHKGNIFLNKRINRNVNIFSHVFLKGETERAENDTRSKVPGYAIVNFSLNIKDLYLKDLELQLSLKNIADKQAFLPSDVTKTPEEDYQRAGRNFFVQATYRF
jgi:outer membrane receptor for ferrienterochelin and colicins